LGIASGPGADYGEERARALLTSSGAKGRNMEITYFTRKVIITGKMIKKLDKNTSS